MWLAEVMIVTQSRKKKDEGISPGPRAALQALHL
jgi:hypothetical protein